MTNNTAWHSCKVQQRQTQANKDTVMLMPPLPANLKKQIKGTKQKLTATN
jgi:hypothetical protein